MKRMNRKRIISELEELRGACFHMMMEYQTQNKQYLVMAYNAHHDNADKLIVELGGDSTKEQTDEIVRLWNNIDNETIIQ